MFENMFEKALKIKNVDKLICRIKKIFLKLQMWKLDGGVNRKYTQLYGKDRENPDQVNGVY